jgi:hypothetical protein
MKYKVDGWSNFCRVFELPESFPNDYCFGGGIAVKFQMVDWFNPVEGLPQPGVSKSVWEKEVGKIEEKEIDIFELEKILIPFLKNKRYIKSGRKYLVLYSFGGSTTF